MTGFSAPAQAFSNLGPNAVARLAYSAADVTLVVDAEGVIRDLAYGSSSLSSEHCDRWLGQRFIQTVSKDSRPKIEALLRDAVAFERINWLMLMMVDRHVHFHVVPRYSGTRSLAKMTMGDSGWPGMANLSHSEAATPELILELRGRANPS